MQQSKTKHFMAYIVCCPYYNEGTTEIQLIASWGPLHPAHSVINVPIIAANAWISRMAEDMAGEWWMALIWNRGAWRSVHNANQTFLVPCIRCTDHLCDSCRLTGINPNFQINSDNELIQLYATGKFHYVYPNTFQEYWWYLHDYTALYMN